MQQKYVRSISQQTVHQVNLHSLVGRVCTRSSVDYRFVLTGDFARPAGF
jgi:hypothetical protein